MYRIKSAGFAVHRLALVFNLIWFVFSDVFGSTTKCLSQGMTTPT